MRKSYKKLLVLGTALTMSVMASTTSFAAISYPEWYYNLFNTYPTGNITEWEQDPVYWQYLDQNDPEAHKKLTDSTTTAAASTSESVYPTDVRWSGTTGKWSVNGKASKYQVRLYKDDKKIATYSTTNRSYSFSGDIKSSADYWFEVRAYSKSGGNWSDWYSSDSEYFKRSTSSSSSSSSSSTSTTTTVSSPGGPGTVNAGTSWSNRWVGGNDTWQVKNMNGNGYVANSWWMDPSTNEWYLMGCTGELGKESYMSAGLFRDAKGDWYLLNPMHDGTYGRMLSGDSNGNYTLNYNGQSIAVKFNKNHDGTYGKIISDVNAVRNILGTYFELNYVPATAQ